VDNACHRKVDRSNWRLPHRLAGQCGVNGGVYPRMRNYLCCSQHSRIHRNNVARNRFTSSKGISRHCCCCHSAVSVVNLIDACNVEDVGNVSYVPNVRDVDDA
jgi:hypothetical protein